jgi:hypothetical protein
MDEIFEKKTRNRQGFAAPPTGIFVDVLLRITFQYCGRNGLPGVASAKPVRRSGRGAETIQNLSNRLGDPLALPVRQQKFHNFGSVLRALFP